MWILDLFLVGLIIEGKSFGGCVEYVLKKDSEIIHANGLRTDSAKTITQDFNFQWMLNPRLSNAVGHIVLSWNTGDKNMLNNDIMVSSAKRYLSKMGIRDTQCLMVRHFDRQHDHIHIIYNRVNDYGKTISNSNGRYKSFKACRNSTPCMASSSPTAKRMLTRDGSEVTTGKIIPDYIRRFAQFFPPNEISCRFPNRIFRPIEIFFGRIYGQRFIEVPKINKKGSKDNGYKITSHA